MANPKNLKKGNPDTQFKSGQRAVEMGRKGGRKFAENQAKRRTLKEATLLALQRTKKQYADAGITFDKELEAISLDDDDGFVLLANKQVLMALFGSHQGYEHTRDIIGEKPVDKQEVEVTDKDPKDMTRKELEAFLMKNMVEE